MWRAPHRTRESEISQTYNDGMVQIFRLANNAEPGYQPKPTPILTQTLAYQERRLGLQRYFQGQQNQVQVSRVIRVPRVGRISNQDLARTEDGVMYEISLCQATTDIYPPSVDITLGRIVQNWEGRQTEVDT